MQTSGSRFDDALAELDQLGGFRAFMLFPPEAADADAIVDALPWVQDGAPRAGALVRLLQVDGGLALITGGALSDAEGAHLFDIHERLKDVVTKVLIVPPASAAPALIARMYETGVVPILPVEKQSNFAAWGAFALMLIFLAARMVRAEVRHGETVSWLDAGILGFASAIGVVWWRSKRKFEDRLADPFRKAACQWVLNVPPRPATP